MNSSHAIHVIDEFITCNLPTASFTSIGSPHKSSRAFSCDEFITCNLPSPLIGSPKFFYPAASAFPPRATSTRVSSSPSLFGFPLPSLSLAAGTAGVPPAYVRPPLPPLVPTTPTYFLPSSPTTSVSSSAAPVLNLDPSGSPLTFRSALAGPHRLQWLQGSDDELIKLVETSRTLCPVHYAPSPATYYNPVAKEKWSPASLLLPGPQRCYTTGVDRRVRGTAGGDRLPSSCPPSTQVASLPCVNILFNSVVSDDAFFGSVDLSDFYLGTDLNPPQFIKIFTHQFSSNVLSRLNLLPFLKTNPSGKAYIVFRIDKTM